MPSLFQSITAFFSAPRDGTHIRRDQAMSSIDDAFSVPPDAEYVSTPTLYTYPPPAQGGSYDTVPFAQSNYDLQPPHSAGSSSGNRSRPASLLPLHSSPLSPLPNYPPLHQTWARLRAWLDDQYPELADTLNWGIQPPDLAHLELQLGLALPPAVRDSYLVVDGQEAESSAGCSEGLFFGLTLLSFEEVVDEWTFWRAVDDDPATGANAKLRDEMRSIPPGWIRREYSQRGWLPLVADKAGNYIGVDMNPDTRGAVGQVIVFGREFHTKVVLWRGDGEGGWARWLASFVEELENGEGFEVGVGEGSEGSEDDVGYDSYFFDGTGRGKGQGGAEGGGGGLRLTGEYRGWTVLEALADRSMKRWIEAGVMPQPNPADLALPTSNAIELAALDVEVSETGEPIVPAQSAVRPTPTSQPNGEPISSHTKPPSISVTKVPVPQPVQLPTEHDFLPSPTYYSPTETTAVYDHDAEERGLSMREVDRATPVQANFGPLDVKEATLVPLPPSTEPSPSKPSPASPVNALPEPLHRQETTDSLLSDSHALLADTPIEPSPSEPTDASQAALSSAILTPTPLDSSDSKSPEPETEEEPQPSVRLVGGGGISGDASLVDSVLEGDTPAASDPSKSDAQDDVLASGKRKKVVE